MITKVAYARARKLVHLDVLRNLALLDARESTAIGLPHIRHVCTRDREHGCVKVL